MKCLCGYKIRLRSMKIIHKSSILNVVYIYIYRKEGEICDVSDGAVPAKERLCALMFHVSLNTSSHVISSGWENVFKKVYF